MLLPPGYGSETLFGLPAPERKPNQSAHMQLVMRVEGNGNDRVVKPQGTGRGAVPVQSSPGVYLLVDLFIRGALWRSSTHRLCLLMDGPPAKEYRSCNQMRGSWNVSTFIFIPSSRPELHDGMVKVAALPVQPPSPGKNAKGQLQAAQLNQSVKLLQKVDICSKELGLAAQMLGSLCIHGGPRSLQALFASPEYIAQVTSQLASFDILPVGAAFIMAALTLPQPFTMVEAGNLCGGSTVYLAMLRRKFCPRCRLISVDPGGYRQRLQRSMSCATETLQWSGLADEQTTLVDDVSAVLSFEQPVGFVYLDDGKTRFYNDPFWTNVEDRLMLGAIVALDDAWMQEPLPHSTDHIGQITFAHELITSGEFTPLAVPSPRSNLRVGEPPSIGHRQINKLMAHTTRQVADKVLGQTHKTVILSKRRSRFTAKRAEPARDAVRCRIVDADDPDVVHAVQWADLPAASYFSVA